MHIPSCLQIVYYWYSLVTRDNKTCLYFVCSNCYAKQTDKYLEWNPIIINTKSQNRNELEHKSGVMHSKYAL